jgi:hypothetical protein
MLIQVAAFFSPRSNVLVGQDDDFALDCYRLAHYYHCSPLVFLDMPLNEVKTHMRYSIRLAELQRNESEDTDRD